MHLIMITRLLATRALNIYKKILMNIQINTFEYIQIHAYVHVYKSVHIYMYTYTSNVFDNDYRTAGNARPEYIQKNTYEYTNKYI